MSRQVRMLWVGSGQVGLVGLDEVFEETRQEKLKGADLERALLEGVKRDNYVPKSSEQDYVGALLREYRRFCGEEVEDELPDILCIEVLGPGCPECDHLEEMVRNVLSELGIGGNVEHVRDPERIKEYGVFGGPGLVINKKLKVAGKVPRRAEVTEWLRSAGATGGEPEGA